jgi:membrane protein DedA with SNARE-associated domain
MDTAEKWFKKYGAPTVFLSRLVPGFRTLIPFPAGAVKMPLSNFIAYTTAGCLVWDIILIYIGVYVGASWQEVAGVLQYLIIVVAIVLMALALFLFGRRKNLKQQESSFSSRFN